MDRLQIVMESGSHVLNFDLELLNNALMASHGKSEMSNEDMKLAILALQGIVKQQQRMIDVMYTTINTKKSFINRIFKK